MVAAYQEWVGRQGMAYVVAVGSSLWAVFYKYSMRDPWIQGGERQLTADLASREIIAKLPHAGLPSLSPSSSHPCYLCTQT